MPIKTWKPIKLSKEIIGMDDEASELGLTEFEYAFYTAVADNKSAKELMQHDKLRELAVILTQRVKQKSNIAAQHQEHSD